MERKVIDQKEYLKKYLSSGNGEDNKKKKKKKVKSKATVKIIDDDIDLKNMRPIEDNEFDIFIHGEDAPLIVGVVDERGPVDFSDKRRWKIMAADEGGDLTVTSREIKQSKKVQNDSVDNLSPPRKEICSNDDLSPPRISEKQKKKSRKDEDNDLSPPRVKSKKHISSKRQTAESNVDSNESQEKDIAVHKSKKKAKRKGKTSDDSDLSPPRKAKNCDSDFSPPRKSRKHKSNNRNESDSDLSPPRKTKNYDSDLSPPRKSKKHKSNNRNQSDSDLSPPRKSRKESDSDLSPRRRNKKNSNSDLSPLRNRRTKNYDSDLSPPRKSKKHKQKTKDSNSDLSPPRRRHEKDTNVHASYRRRDRNDQSDFSPPIKHKHRDERSERSRSYKHSEKNSKSDRRWNDSDMNPPRRMHRDVDTSSSSFREGGRDRSKSHKTNYRYDDDSNRLPREDSYDRKSTQKDSDETDSDKRMKKTLDGKKAGLQGARELREEIEAHKKREAEHFKMLSKEVTGAGQAAVVRDTKTGRKRDLEAEAAEKRERQKRQAELDAKYAKWGKGLKQVEDHDDKLKDDLYEMTKPLARYADDADLDKRLRDQDREGDPMLEYIKQKQIKEGKREADRPTYEGSFMPNRFGIKPGCRWDGVDRSNGYEKKWFDAQNAKVALQEEAYKWSTSDM